MKFNSNTSVAGMHAFLSPSSYYWLNYDDEKLLQTYTRRKAALRGTELHDLAARLISMGVKVVNNKQTFNQYVNDGIGYRMTAEQPLFYSINCFGTADTISFNRGLLRIHDLKTGITPTSEKQLYIYAALFCLEYDYKPTEISYALRIYQEGEVREYEPTADEIAHVMDRIVYMDKRIIEIQERL